MPQAMLGYQWARVLVCMVVVYFVVELEKVWSTVVCAAMHVCCGCQEGWRPSKATR
jgi:hypothetical protein